MRILPRGTQQFILHALGAYAFAQICNFFALRWFAQSVVVNQSALFNISENIWFVAGVIAAGLLLTWFIWRQVAYRPMAVLALAFILAGATSNITDRLVYGGVIDYLPFFGLSTFNVADVEIFVGALGLALADMRPKAQTEDYIPEV